MIGWRSKDYADLFWAAWGLSLLLKGLLWLLGADDDATGWRIVAGVIAFFWAIGALGWSVLRFKEWRAGQPGTVTDAARPWVAPLLAIGAIGLALWMAQSFL